MLFPKRPMQERRINNNLYFDSLAVMVESWLLFMYLLCKIHIINRYKTLLTIFCLLLCLFSCGSKPYPYALLSADSLMNTCLDSAVILLEKMEDGISQESKEIQMFYWLLTIKAKDKAYITHTSDSLIQTIVHYYEKKKDEKYLPEAYYYAGRVYRDLGDAPQALDYFFKAAEIAKGCTDYRLISRIYSQTGTLFLYQDTYNEALDVFRKACQYCFLAKDSIGVIYSLRDIGRTFTTLNRADSSIYYYKKAFIKAEQMQNKPLMGIVLSELSGLYLQLNRYPEASDAIQRSNQYIKNLDLAPHNTILADYYYQMNQYDSAAFYYTKALSSDDFYQKQSSYKGLGSIARRKGRYEEAVDYFDKYLIYTDSIKAHTHTETVRKMQSLYNYQLREKKNRELQQENAMQKLWLMALISVIMLLMALFISYHQYNKRKKQKRLAQQRLLDEYKEKRYHESIQYIRHNERQLCLLEETLKQAEDEKNELWQHLINARKELLVYTNKQVEAKQKTLQISEMALKESEIYKKFHLANQNSKIKPEDWNLLAEEIDKTYNDFTSRLYALYPFSERDIRICLLIKINLRPSQIAPLIPCAKQTLTSIRKRMYERVHNQCGTPESWDDFIRKF